MNQAIDQQQIPEIGQLFRLDNQVAVVTGAGNGIGRMAAHILAQGGARVIVTDLEADSAQSVVAEIKAADGQADAEKLDVTDETSIVDTFADISQRHGRLDILVNSAGAAKRQATIETPLEIWNHVLAVNLTGVFLCCREAGKQMLAQGSGSIINLSSIMGHSGGGLYPNPSYHATKGAVVNLTRALAAEWGSSGVRVNDIAPTFVKTRFTAGLLSDNAMRSAIEQQTPMGCIAEVGDLAGAILYLASSASKLVTGHSLAVDGGYLAR